MRTPLPHALILAVITTGNVASAEDGDSSTAEATPAENPSGEVTLPEVVVPLHYRNRVGTADAASAGTVTHELIEDRPLLRPAEVLELVPGLIITQHSGAGKANQYFLRGFNLDHGTDFATSLEGVPVNLPTNAHGQGYMDLNFLIPELVARADYWKGPYYAHEGDFSSAGAEDIYYATNLPKTLVLGTLGSFGYQRALLAASPSLGAGTLLFALELLHENGPWDVPEDYRKLNGLLRWTQPVGTGTLSLIAMGYASQWNATNQVAERAIASGEIGYFGSLSPTDGGSTSRYSLSASWQGEAGGGRLRADIYAARYQLDLFSDFTYYLEDPVNGDQMDQYERRWFQGTSWNWSWVASPGGMDLTWTVGLEGRADEISPLGLSHTVNRQWLQTWDQDRVFEASAALWGQVAAHPTPWLRAVLGLRGTSYRFDVQSNDPRNSGTKNAGLLLPKATLVLGPWAKTEYFANYGEGYHSNDARGVTSTIDAKTGEPIQPVTALVRSRGAEIGVRTEAIPHVQTSLAFWVLDLDSELVWDADDGTTTPSAPTRRVGIEWASSYQPSRWLACDLNVAFSRATFRQDDPTTGELAGQPVPEAIQSVVGAGAAVHELGRWSGSLFLRYFGPRVLCTVGTCGGTGGPSNDTPIWSAATTILNGQVSYDLTQDVRVALEGLNLLNAKVNDITYYYQSRLRGESPANYPEGIWDYEVHPAEPIEVRGTVMVRF